MYNIDYENRIKALAALRNDGTITKSYILEKMNDNFLVALENKMGSDAYKIFFGIPRYIRCILQKVSNNRNIDGIKELVDILADWKFHSKCILNLNETGIENYVSLFRLMKKTDHMELLSYVDEKIFCSTMNKGNNMQIWLIDAVELFPYFNTKLHFIHSLSHHKWIEWYGSRLSSNTLKSEDDRKLFFNKLCHEKFIFNLDAENIGVILKHIEKHGDIMIDIYRFLFEKCNGFMISVFYRSYLSFDFENIKHMEHFLDNLKELEKYSKVDFSEIFAFLTTTKFNVRTLFNLVKQLPKMDLFEQSLLFNLPPVMIMAWINKREDILSLAAKDWYITYYSCDSNEKINQKDYFLRGYDSILLYALCEKKESFLSLVVNDKIGPYELNYLDDCCEIISTFMNLNEFNHKQINQLKSDDLLRTFSDDRTEFFNQLKMTIRKYNFTEIEVLSKIKKSRKVTILKIFLQLLEEIRSDNACIRTKQLLNVGLPMKDDKGLDKVAQALMLHDIPAWGKILYSYEAPTEVIVRSLPYTELRNVMQEAKNNAEARFIIEKSELCKNGLKEAMKCYQETDEDILKLKAVLDLPESFYEEYKESCYKFFINEGAYISNAYIRTLESEGFTTQINKFKVVIKAAISGKLDKVRYFENDLNKECSIEVPEVTKSEWCTDRCKKIGKYTCFEDTSFNGIMSMGLQPTSTCMSYKFGVYAECLLAYFDGNKKVVYIKNSDHKIIARAVIRLTKATRERGVRTTLDFVDVTKIDEGKEKENMIIFLERFYTGYQGTSQNELENVMIQFVKEKAKEANVGLVLSRDYHVNDEFFNAENIGVYITKSKAGSQYLDSFGGKKDSGYSSANGEDVYIYSPCLVLEGSL
jgi:hypothetical protein